MSLPQFPQQGGCQSGSVHNRLGARPLTIYNCHCKDCQRFSGAGWSMSMIVRSEDFVVSGGPTVRYDRKADSGNIIVMNFCANCHGWLWNDPPDDSIKVVRAGTLDDIDWARPVGNIWTSSKAAWAEIDPALVNYDKGIKDRTPLFEAWTRAHRAA